MIINFLKLLKTKFHEFLNIVARLLQQLTSTTAQLFETKLTKAVKQIDETMKKCSASSEYNTLVRAECLSQCNEVAIKLGIIFSSSSLLLSLSRHLLNLQERVVVGFPNFAWAPK